MPERRFDDDFTPGDASEPENDELHELRVEVRALRMRLREIEKETGARVPDTMLIDKSLLKRSFAVFGHHLVANIIISIIIGIPIFLIFVLIGLSL